MNNTSKKPRKTSSSAEQLAACSLISGIAGIICSLFYLPFSLVSGKNTPMGLICGVIGIVLAIMAKKTRTSVRERNIQVRHWLVLSSV
mgnify:CR=1 FL=1